MIFNNYLTEVAKELYEHTNFYLVVYQKNVKELLLGKDKFIVKL